MPFFAVAYLDFYNNENIIELVEADDWKQAIKRHSKLKCQGEQLEEWIDNMPFDLEKVKVEFFNGDICIDVIVIPKNLTKGEGK